LLNSLPLEKESQENKKNKKNRKCQRKAKKISRSESFPLASLGLPKNSISLSIINAKK
jgi:hypothetical protein